MDSDVLRFSFVSITEQFLCHKQKLRYLSPNFWFHLRGQKHFKKLMKDFFSLLATVWFMRPTELCKEWKVIELWKITSHTTGAKGCKFEQFWTIWSLLNLFLYLSRSILSISIYLDLSRPILDHLSLSWFSWAYLFLLWSISGYIELSKAIFDKN